MTDRKKTSKYGSFFLMGITMQSLHISDVALFFEFKHYKPKKKQLSTKCWAFMEKDEIKEGQTVIEL